MTNHSKDIIQWLAKWYEGKIAGCACGGSGKDYCSGEWQDGSNIDCEKDCPLDIENPPDNGPCETTCPTCAPWREAVKRLCWHEWDKLVLMPKLSKCACGAEYRMFKHDIETRLDTYAQSSPRCASYGGSNPDLTCQLDGTQWLVIKLLDDAGLLDEFRLHMSNTISDMCWERENIKLDFDQGSDVDSMEADILTDGKLLTQAVWEWMKGR